MKDLITIFSFCPTFEKKKILNDLLSDLQPKREKYDIMVVSHSPISDLSLDMVDYFYYDKENILLKDFGLTNKFWFNTDNLAINTSLVYPFSTHLTIYRLIYFTLNFSKFQGYRKTHFVEYDIKMDDYNLIDEVNSKLDEYDNLMFKGDDNWVWGVYFASNNHNFDASDFLYDEKKIIDDLISVENRMTEYVTPKLLSIKGRTIFYENITKIDSQKICQKVDEHFNDTISWCVPLVLEDGDDLCFFIYNEKGFSSLIDVFVDDKYYGFSSNHQSVWTLNNIGRLSETNKIEIFIDKKLRNKIIFDDSNRNVFRKNNFYRYF
jgi:hypothetical protein